MSDRQQTSVDAPEAPTEDLEIVQIAADVALENYAASGGFHPFAVMDTSIGMLVVPSEGFSSPDDKRTYTALLRYVSIENGGRRTALAMETWTLVKADDGDMALMREIHARGGSMSDHPKAGEAVVVIAESDAGTTMRMHVIVRDGVNVNVTLEPGETSFKPRDGTEDAHGLMSNFHVPTAVQSDPQSVAYATTMRTLFDTRMERIDPTAAHKPN